MSILAGANDDIFEKVATIVSDLPDDEFLPTILSTGVSMVVAGSVALTHEQRAALCAVITGMVMSGEFDGVPLQ